MGKTRKRETIIIIIGIIAVLLFSVIFYIVGRNSQISQQVINRYAAANDKLLEVSREIITKKGIISNAEKYYKNKNELEKDITEAKNNYAKILVDIQEKEREKQGLEQIIAKLTGQVEEIKNKPIVLVAGNYVVGEDIEAGKYDLECESGSGNLFVRNAFGKTKVNEIIGKDESFYTRRYNNAELNEGDTIEITSNLKVKFTRK